MIPAAFGYERVDTVDAAIAALRAKRARSAGRGHSLLPQIKLRVRVPNEADATSAASHDLSYVREDGDGVAIGALTRYHDLEASEELRQLAPIGPPWPASRRSAGPHMGTIGARSRTGSELATCLGAARARCDFVATGPGGMPRSGRRHVSRSVPVALASDEC